MDLMLQDKVALISGGSKGIGFHIAKDLADEGCHVVISGRTEADLQKAEAEINAQGKGKAVSFCGDMTKPEASPAFLKIGLDTFGGVDLLVNNVGGSNTSPLLDTTDDDWQTAFDFNLFHAVRLSRLVIPEMKKRGGGSILNIASIAGRESAGAAITYNASKAALISFSKVLSQQVAKDGVRVNALAPGSVFFPGGVWERRMAEAPDNLEGKLKGMPLGRFGRPEEISSVAVFMLSPRASLVNGACYAVDGSQGHSNI